MGKITKKQEERIKNANIFNMATATSTLGQAFLFVTIIGFITAILWDVIRGKDISSTILIILTIWSIIGILILNKSKQLIERKEQITKGGR